MKAENIRPADPGLPAHADSDPPETREWLDAFDAVLHDPPRFGIAGELYSQNFYTQLARVLKRRGKMFHYTGAPNKHSRGRDLAGEVASRLRAAGFAVEPNGDGLLVV